MGSSFEMKWKRSLRNLVALILIAVILTGSVSAPFNSKNKLRQFTRVKEFDYAIWMLDALVKKSANAALGITRYTSDEQQREIVFSYLALVKEANRVDNRIVEIFSDPGVTDPLLEAGDLLKYQSEVNMLQEQWGRLAEAVIQYQISQVLAIEDMAAGGQPVPPLLYKVTPLPLALIVSPRSVIRQDEDISLLPDLSLDQIVAIEQQVEASQDVSALVVQIGGVGVYPTMVMRSSNLPWLIEVVAHEWTHNYLTMRPLGIHYYSSQELRTMNETTANVVGKEISRRVLAQYYPEYAPAPVPAATSQTQQSHESTIDEPPAFQYRQEMYETRVTVDRLLEAGQIQEAEQYMEARRKVFVENGYNIRRLNQAYFAFYGAYADSPTGAFGEDPVGPMVQRLRTQSSSLKEFVNTIAAMTSFEQLQERVQAFDSNPETE